MKQQLKTNSYKVEILIAGDFDAICEAARTFCDANGLRVAVTSTRFIYTGGEEAGAIVTLINYARFPSTPEEIDSKALQLAKLMRVEAGAWHFTIQTPHESTFYSWRDK